MNKELKKLVRGHTGARGDIRSLAGPYNKEKRREIMQLIRGRNVTLKESGVTALFVGLRDRAGISGGITRVEQERQLVDWVLS